MKEVDIEDINNKVAEVISREFPTPKDADIIKYKGMVEDILKSDHYLPESEFSKLRKKYKFNEKKSYLFHVYLELKRTNQIDISNESILRRTLQIKPCKSWSGIVSITIFTSAYPEYTNEKGERIKQDFSCKFSCSFCSCEPNMPKSYLSLEPGVLRAIRNDFDCARQVWDRMCALYMTGHDIDKIELIVSGGTWSSYPQQYREEFCRDIYYATNTYSEIEPRRERLPLEEEKKINQTTKHRIVGLTIETRPDNITALEIKRFRQYGITRVQLGVQSIYDEVLDKNNRQCKTARTIKAIQLLKENCYKIDGHWMLNLPGSTVETDNHMMNEVLFKTKSLKTETKYYNRSWYEYFTGKNKQIKELWEYWDIASPELNFDGVKIYPTAIIPWTEIEKWFKEGTYVPYDEKSMFDILVKTSALMFPWVRIARIIRDIPEIYMYNENTGADNTNMRQELNDYLIKNNIYCMDIRNREVKNKEWNGEYVIVIRKYNASNGDEYFISSESEAQQLNRLLINPCFYL